jgi:diacylglycerol kinase family enzyme
MRRTKNSDEIIAPQFDRLLIFVNPKSTNTTAVQKRIKEVNTILADLPCTIIVAEGDNWSSNAKLLEHYVVELGPRSLLCIAAGDGTTNYIIETLLTAKNLPDTARQTVILPLWGGNANDLAHMLNGPAFRANLREIITRGHIVPIHPLECTMHSKSGKRINRIAACYASFGATAFAAQKLNDELHRNRLARWPVGRFMQELITVVGAFIDAPTFSIKEQDTARVVYERTFSNGSRMAKITRLPVQLTDEVFYFNTFENKRLVSAIPRLIATGSKRLSAKFLSNFAYFTVQEKSWAQFDGEPVEIPAHTKVQVQLSKRPFYALSLTLVAAPAKEDWASHKAK